MKRPALVHMGHEDCVSNHRCEPGTAVVFHPLGDHFVCSQCLVPLIEARVGMSEWPVPIRASQYGPAGRSGLMDGNARALALAELYDQGDILRFVSCSCGCVRLVHEIPQPW